jgi:hypothetical protein
MKLIELKLCAQSVDVLQPQSHLSGDLLSVDGPGLIHASGVLTCRL